MTLGFAVSVSLCWRHGSGKACVPRPEKNYSQLIAEGVRYRDCEMLGVDRFAFKRCRIEKRRSGGVTFGGFNVLVVDDLTVTFDATFKSCKEEEMGSQNALAHALIRSQGLSARRVSGMRIDGLTVNRCVSNKVERLVFAKLAESGNGVSKGLRLHTCTVGNSDEAGAQVPEAHLVLRPEPTLIFRQNGTERQIKICANDG